MSEDNIIIETSHEKIISDQEKEKGVLVEIQEKIPKNDYLEKEIDGKVRIDSNVNSNNSNKILEEKVEKPIQKNNILEKETSLNDIKDDDASIRFKKSDELKQAKKTNFDSIVKPSNFFNFELDLNIKKSNKITDKLSNNNKNVKSSTVINQISNLKDLEFYKNQLFKESREMSKPYQKGTKIEKNQIERNIKLEKNEIAIDKEVKISIPDIINMGNNKNININFNSYNNINHNYNITNIESNTETKENNENIKFPGSKKSFNTKLMDLYNDLNKTNQQTKNAEILSNLNNLNSKNLGKNSIVTNCNADSYQEQFDRFYINFKAKKTQNLMNYPVFTSKGLQFSNNTKNSTKLNEKKNDDYKKLNIETFKKKMNIKQNPTYNKLEKILNNDFILTEEETFNLQDEMVDLDEEILKFRNKHSLKGKNEINNSETNKNIDPIMLESKAFSGIGFSNIEDKHNFDFNDFDSNINLDDIDNEIHENRIETHNYPDFSPVRKLND